jgi:gamma-glutamylaminecyclotransferase
MTQEIRPEQTGDEMLVFVYGRMKQGGADHAILAGSRFLGQALTAPVYDLVDLGGLPGLTKEGGMAVHGEIYAVDRRTLTSLDEFEDHPDTFHRDNLLLDDGREVLGYVLPAAQATGFPRMSSGSWNEALAG